MAGRVRRRSRAGRGAGRGLAPLLLKLARAVHSGRPLDASAILAGMADTWDALAVELQKARAARVA